MDWQPGSGRPQSARTLKNVAAVDDLVLSHDGAPQTHRTTCQIALETGIHRSAVIPIVHHKDLQLKCMKKRRAQELTAANRETRLIRSQRLLWKYSKDLADFIFFTDAKFFMLPWRRLSTCRTIACTYQLEPKNARIFAHWLLRIRPTFSKLSRCQ